MHSNNELEQHKLSYQQQLPIQMVTAVVVLDNKLNIQYVNPAAEALLIKSSNKLSGLSFAEVFNSTSINNERLNLVLSSGQEFSDSDVILEFFDGYHITVEMTASSVDFNRKPHVLLEFKQVDQQKKISAEAFQQQQWESARHLIRGLAHEIKNPLGGLRGAAQLLDKEITTEQQEYTSMIIEQVDRLSSLVDRLLGPNQLPKMTTQNVHVVLEKVYKLIRCNNPKNIQFIRDYDPSIPEMTFDEDKLQQAILNIISNAIQAINVTGNITLRTRIASNQTINGKKIKLSVQISLIDDGPGIPANIQDTLFYPLVSGRDNGTGLGLSISQTLIHQHQGKLSCRSRPGCTEFIILLPFLDNFSVNNSSLYKNSKEKPL